MSLQEFEEKANNLVRWKAKIEQESENQKRLIQQKTTSIELLRSELEECKKEVYETKIKLEEAKNSNEELLMTKSKLNNLVKMLEMDLKQLSRSIGSQKKLCEGLDHKGILYDNELIKLSQQFEEILSTHERVKNEYSDKINSATSHLSMKEEEIKKIKIEFHNEKEKLLKSTNEALLNKNSDIEELKVKIDNYEKRIDQLIQSETNLGKEMRDNIRINSEYKNKMEREVEVLKIMEDDLKLSLENEIKKVEALKKSLVSAEEIKNSLEVKMSDLNEEVDVLRRKNSALDGINRSLTENLNLQKEELEKETHKFATVLEEKNEISKEAYELKIQINKANDELKDSHHSKTILQKIKKENAELNLRYSDLEINFNNSELEKKNAIKSLEILKETLSTKESLYSTIKTDLEVCLTAKSSLESRVEKQSNDIFRLKKHIEESEKLISTLKQSEANRDSRSLEENQILKEKISKLETLLESKMEEIKNHQMTINNLKSDENNLSENIISRESALQEKLAQIVDLKIRLQESEKKLESMTADKKLLNDEVNALMKENSYNITKLKRLQDLEYENKTTKEEIIELEQTISKLKRSSENRNKEFEKELELHIRNKREAEEKASAAEKRLDSVIMVKTAEVNEYKMTISNLQIENDSLSKKSEEKPIRSISPPAPGTPKGIDEEEMIRKSSLIGGKRTKTLISTSTTGLNKSPLKKELSLESPAKQVKISNENIKSNIKGQKRTYQRKFFKKNFMDST